MHEAEMHEAEMHEAEVHEAEEQLYPAQFEALYPVQFPGTLWEQVTPPEQE